MHASQDGIDARWEKSSDVEMCHEAGPMEEEEKFDQGGICCSYRRPLVSGRVI